MRGMLIVVPVLIFAVTMIAADAPKAPAAEPKKAPTAEVKKTEPAAPKKAEPAAETKKVEPAPAAAPAAPAKPAEEPKKEEPKKEDAKKEEAPKAAPLPDPKVYDIKEETVTDTKTNLVWQRKKGDKSMTHKEAEDYCGTLTLAGADDWRLPTVTELRTLIVGCQSGTETCKVDEKCLDSKCWSTACACQALKGPGEDGFYWQKDVWQGGGKYFWSSSLRPTKKAEKAWDVGFNYGNVYEYDRAQKADVRCVRAAAPAPVPATPAAAPATPAAATPTK